MAAATLAHVDSQDARGRGGHLIRRIDGPGHDVEDVEAGVAGLAFEIAPGKEMICQKSAFLASEASVTLSISFQKKLGSGLFILN